MGKQTVTTGKRGGQSKVRKQLIKVEAAVNEYLELSEQIRELKKRQEALVEEVIEPYAKENLEYEDRLEFERGYIGWSKGRAKLVDERGKSITVLEKRALAKRLPEEYIKKDIDLSVIEKRYSEDKILQKIFTEYSIRLVREPNLMIKPLKARKS